jgi:hypothetical protein
VARYRLKNGRVLNEFNEVAVIYNPDHSTGWSAYNPGYPEMLFDPEVVAILLNQPSGSASRSNRIMDYVEAHYPQAYVSTKDLKIEWVDEGREFIIHEYDGSEAVWFKDELKWITP